MATLQIADQGLVLLAGFCLVTDDATQMWRHPVDAREACLAGAVTACTRDASSPPHPLLGQDIADPAGSVPTPEQVES